MIDIKQLILELEMHLEGQELLKHGLSQAEVNASFEFEYDFGSWDLERIATGEAN